MNKRKFIEGLLDCYMYSKIQANYSHDQIYFEIIDTVEFFLISLNEYERKIIVDRFFLRKSISRMAIDRNYKNHSSISKYVKNIIDNINV